MIGLQKKIMDNQFKVNKIIKGKEEMYAELSKEFDRINDETGKEMETMRVMFRQDLEKEKVEHNELRDELEKNVTCSQYTTIKYITGFYT